MTMPRLTSPMHRPIEEPIYSKVVAGSAGAGVGAALAAIIVFILAQVGIDAAVIEWAFAIVFSAAGSFLGGYVRRETRAR